MARIVVGVDGSPESRAALRWALEEARLRNAAVRAVYAWTFPYLGGYAGATLTIPVDELQRDADALVEAVVADEAEGASVPVTSAAVEGIPSDVLVDASKDADLLVVGSRGRGGFTGLLLGSVSQQCAHHAACPVVILRSPHPAS